MCNGATPFLPPASISGIAADAREEGLNQAPTPLVYFCASAPGPSPFYLIRTRGEPAAMGETLRRRIKEIEPLRSVFGIMPLEAHWSDAATEDRLRAWLIGLFALTSVARACIGLYGTLSYLASVGRREVGVRLALGAAPAQIVQQFFGKGLALAGVSCVLGLILSVGFSRLLSGMLYGVTASDPITLAGVLAVVMAVAGGASLIPSVRASRLDAIEVLRED